jgi:hypothetical protein
MQHVAGTLKSAASAALRCCVHCASFSVVQVVLTHSTCHSCSVSVQQVLMYVRLVHHTVLYMCSMLEFT